MSFTADRQWVAENAVLLRWPNPTSAALHQHILQFEQNLKRRAHQAILDTVPSYASLLIYYSHDTLDAYALNAMLDAAEQDTTTQLQLSTQTLTVPVFYQGWDLARVAGRLALSLDDVITLHCEHSYRVFATGFAPGFAYLGTLPQALHSPRLSTPRRRVPRGAVAIADAQTAIYPSASPGGWQILGFTPVSMLDDATPPMPVLKPGMTVRFEPCDKQEYLSAGGTLEPQPS